MTNYREILRLHSQGLSQRSIAASCNCSKSTVQRAIMFAKEQDLSLPLAPEFTNELLRKLILSNDTGDNRESGEKTYKEPDYEHIHKEMAKRGVTLSLLWNEYCAQCRHNGEIPYMYTAYRQEGRVNAKRLTFREAKTY